MGYDTVSFAIDRTCNGDQYVVIINTTGAEDGWNDLTEPFDTYKQAVEWAKKIKGTYGVYGRKENE